MTQRSLWRGTRLPRSSGPKTTRSRSFTRGDRCTQSELLSQQCCQQCKDDHQITEIRQESVKQWTQAYFLPTVLPWALPLAFPEAFPRALPTKAPCSLPFLYTQRDMYTDKPQKVHEHHRFNTLMVCLFRVLLRCAKVHMSRTFGNSCYKIW